MKLKTILSSIAVVTSAFTFNTQAEIIPGTSLSINLESANIVGSGRNLNMHRVPVVDIDTGETTLIDAAFKFSYTPSEGMEFVQISSAAVSPPMSVANIIPGVYKSQEGYCYKLEGPNLLDSNRSLYTFRGDGADTFASDCRNDGDDLTIQIVSGSATNHPDIGHREIVGHLPENYTYGYIANAADSNDAFRYYNNNSSTWAWSANKLIGVRQSGEQFIVGLFSEGVDNSGNIVDFDVPRQTVILTKIN